MTEYVIRGGHPLSGEIVVDTAIGENAADVTALREAVRP